MKIKGQQWRNGLQTVAEIISLDGTAVLDESRLVHQGARVKTGPRPYPPPNLEERVEINYANPGWILARCGSLAFPFLFPDCFLSNHGPNVL